ncbi:histidinol-phosphate transaminase [Devosia rhodophyticola]|uniref:Histidinol-phosphate aminotransferase n=1 Tax=Devosia rhodophyticola TaxID=3026423 RepID=A0ABY7YTE7_9HYPH|nr:histidinol-phosphate transaminase [Devosia rhodophyticola]WDR04613.1 histidinol-phosphate transaminase [Devosia rhodophyticola]
MTNRPKPQPGILEIAPYVPGRSQAAAGQKAIKLSSNESPLGASPQAIAAYKGVGDHLEIYPEGSSAVLREALAEVHGLDGSRIVCGNGSDDLLHLLAQCYIGDGDEAVMSQYGFSVYPIVTEAAGGRIVMAPESDFVASVDSILAAVSERTRIVFLANPNNPTGTYLGASEVRRLQAGLRPDVLLVLDSAYAEYVTTSDYSVGVDLVERADNVVMVRTFSKMGLAAARVGWLYGPAHVADALNRIRGPFNVNLGGQLAAAAATRDVDFTRKLARYNAQWRDWLSAQLGSNQMRVVPSQANFIMVLFAEPAHADAAFEALLAKGLIVRQVGSSYGIANGLRISIGPEAAMRAVADVLKNMVFG